MLATKYLESGATIANEETFLVLESTEMSKGYLKRFRFDL